MAIFIDYRYRIAGEADIKRSMASIADYSEKLGQRVARTQDRQRRGISGGGAANSNSSTREAEAYVRAQERAAQKAEQAKDRAEKRAADKAIREHERAEKAQTRATEKEARERARIEERWAGKNRQLKESHLRALAAREVEEQRVAQRAKATQANVMLGAGRGALSAVGGVIRGATALAGVSGGFLAATALHGGMRDKRAASDLANQLAPTGATQAQIEADKKALLASANKIVGAKSEDVLRGQSAFHSVAGEGEATKKIGQKLVTTQLATGGDISDIGGMYSAVYASLRNASGGAQKSVDQLIEETDEMGRVFAAMGAKGAIELKDFAAIGGTVAAVAGQYSGDRIGSLKHAAAVAQIARQTGGADSASEAATAIQSFSADLIQHSKDARLMGVDVYANKEKTKLRDMPTVIAELMAGTGGNLEKLSGVVNIRGIKALRGFSDPYLDAYKGAKATGAGEKAAKEAGKSAVIKQLSEFGGATFTKEDFEARAKSTLANEDMQLEQAMKRLNVALASQLLPLMPPFIKALSDAIPTITNVISGMAKLAQWALANPFSGLSALISAAILKELLAAQIGSTIRSLLAGTGFGGGRIGPALGGMGLGGKIGAGASAAAVGVTAGVATYTILDTLGNEATRRASGATQQLGEMERDYFAQRGAIMSGEGTEEEKGRRLAELSDHTGKNVELARENVTSWMPDWMRGVFGSGTAQAADKSSQEFQKMIAADQAKAAKMMMQAAEKMGAVSGGPVAGAQPGRGNAPSPVTG